MHIAVRPTSALLLALLTACGPSSSSPEGVARRFTEAARQGQPDVLLPLVSRADRAAAASSANASDPGLHPDADAAAGELRAMMARASKTASESATIRGDRAEVLVRTQVPNVNISDLYVAALFTGKTSGTALLQDISERVRQAPLQEQSETVRLVREEGLWRVDTLWAEHAEAKRLADIEAARAKRFADLQDAYLASAEQDFLQARTALNALTLAAPNDAGWARSLRDMKVLLTQVKKLSVHVSSAELNQGEYQIKATVTSALALPLKTFTVKFTFMNGALPVGAPVYSKFSSSSFFSSRVLDPGGRTAFETTGTPAAQWSGASVRAEITAFEVDTP